MVNLPARSGCRRLIFLAVALGTIAVALLLEWLQEQQRSGRSCDQLRAFANVELTRAES